MKPAQTLDMQGVEATIDAAEVALEELQRLFSVRRGSKKKRQLPYTCGHSACCSCRVHSSQGDRANNCGGEGVGGLYASYGYAYTNHGIRPPRITSVISTLTLPAHTHAEIPYGNQNSHLFPLIKKGAPTDERAHARITGRSQALMRP